MPVVRVPASVSTLELERTADSLGVNISEPLSGVPGVMARERQNLAQDLQISIRGFGTRSTFGIRGIRLYQDGIPATMPDGQGQVSNINLASASRIEVLRGPFSVLYGNASGGVIQVFTADGATDPGARIGLAAGSDGVLRSTADLRGTQGDIDYNLALTRLRTDGYRQHSLARRDTFNAKFKWSPTEDTSLSVIANALRSPVALDPLGLTAAQMAENPRQAVSAAVQFDTRKSLDHSQLGVVVETTLGTGHVLRWLAYSGSRQVTQFLAVPVGAQNNPLNGGGVIDLESRFQGLDLRWSRTASLAGKPLQLVVGINADQQHQRRLGFENFASDRLGVKGRLRRDQHDTVRNFDQYAQANWSLTARLDLMLGARRSHVDFLSRDRYITSTNPDDSGRRRFTATSPVAGLNFQPLPSVGVYVAFGRGFETPTFDELGYRPDGSAGLNFALEAARSRSAEVGVKTAMARGASLELAAFRADTDDELVVATNAGGRSTFQNVGAARRLGLELSAAKTFSTHWRAELAATYLHATFLRDFLVCASSPCASAQIPVRAGTPIPGVPRRMLQADLAWDGGHRWRAALSGRFIDSMTVNNAGTARAAAYAVLDATATLRFAIGTGSGDAFLRIGNVLDRAHAGSVIINETSGRYFEPAPGRNLLVGVDWRW